MGYYTNTIGSVLNGAAGYQAVLKAQLALNEAAAAARCNQTAALSNYLSQQNAVLYRPQSYALLQMNSSATQEREPVINGETFREWQVRYNSRVDELDHLNEAWSYIEGLNWKNEIDAWEVAYAKYKADF